MAYRIDRGLLQEADPKRQAQKDPDYLAFIRTLPCIVTRRSFQVQAAHLSFSDRAYGHYGRAKSSKASDRWALPLCFAEHSIQHRGNERIYWQQRDINPHVACLIIWGLWTEAGDDVRDEVTNMILRGVFK